MANRLAIDRIQGMMQPFAADTSERPITETLDIARRAGRSRVTITGCKKVASPTIPSSGVDSLGSEEPKRSIY